MPGVGAVGGDWNALPRQQKRFASILLAVAAFGGYFVGPRFFRPREYTGAAIFRPTAGRAFNAGHVVKFFLPNGWRIRYNGHQPFREATLFDANGKPQFELTVDIRDVFPPTVKDFAGKSVTLATNAQRRTKRGSFWWVVSLDKRPSNGRLFIMADKMAVPAEESSVLQFQGAEKWDNRAVIWKFRTFEDRGATLEPLAWEMINSAQFSKE